MLLVEIKLMLSQFRLQLSGPEVPELRRKSGIVKLEGSRASNISNRDLSRKPLFVDNEEDDEQSSISDDSIEVEQHSWFDQEGLNHGEMKRLGKKEEVFWNQLLDKYLHPIDDSDKKVNDQQQFLLSILLFTNIVG